MCPGEKCLVKNDCIRFNSEKNRYYQSYFTETPFKIEGNVFICEHYRDNEGNTSIIERVGFIKSSKKK